MLYSVVTLAAVIAACVGAEKVVPEKKVTGGIKTSITRMIQAKLEKALKEKHNKVAKEENFDVEGKKTKGWFKVHDKYLHIHGYSDDSCSADPVEVTTYNLNTCYDTEGSYLLLAYKNHQHKVRLQLNYYGNTNCAGTPHVVYDMSSVFHFSCGGYDDVLSTPQDGLYYYDYIYHGLSAYKATISNQLTDYGSAIGIGYKTYATSAACTENLNTDLFCVDWLNTATCFNNGDGTYSTFSCDSGNNQVVQAYFTDDACSTVDGTVSAGAESTNTCSGSTGPGSRSIAFCGTDTLTPMSVTPTLAPVACNSALRGTKAEVACI